MIHDITTSLSNRIDVTSPTYWMDYNVDNYAKCNRKGPTNAESDLIAVLNKCNIPYLVEVGFTDFLNENGNMYRYDFGIIKKHLNSRVFLLALVEVDGTGHCLRPNWRTIDHNKEQYCIDHNIQFVRLHYLEFFFNRETIQQYFMSAYSSEIFYDIHSIPSYQTFKN